MLSEPLISAAEDLSALLRAQGKRVTTVESCTGGLVGSSITALAGSSETYPGGFITYSNELKVEMVGVSQTTLEAHGAVSSYTAIEMARGGQERTGAHYAVSITGIAGPGGGNDVKPVGTVWICVRGPESQIDCRRFVFPGDRSQIRELSAINSIRMANQMLAAKPATLEYEHERFAG